MVYSTPSKWVMQKQPPLAKPDGGPDAAAYHGIFDAFYRGAFDAGLQVRILHARQLHDPSGDGDPEEAARRHPVLVVPALYVADDETLDWLAAYAEAGGHLVLGPRTGYADHEARARTNRRPAGWPRPPGSGTTSSATWARRSRCGRPGGPLDLPAGARGHALGRRAHRHGRRGARRRTTTRTSAAGPRSPPAATARAGSPTSARCPAATSPGRSPQWLAPAAERGWRDLPASVTATTGTAPDGRRVHVVHNWSWDPAHVTAPVALSDVLDGTAAPAGTALGLGAWDVRILVTACDETASA